MTSESDSLYSDSQRGQSKSFGHTPTSDATSVNEGTVYRDSQDEKTSNHDICYGMV